MKIRARVYRRYEVKPEGVHTRWPVAVCEQSVQGRWLQVHGHWLQAAVKLAHLPASAGTPQAPAVPYAARVRLGSC